MSLSRTILRQIGDRLFAYSKLLVGFCIMASASIFIEYNNTIAVVLVIGGLLLIAFGFGDLE